MTDWEDRLEQIIRGDLGRFAHLRSGNSRIKISDLREQPLVRRARAILADGSPPPRITSSIGISHSAPGDIMSGQAPLRPGEFAVETRHDGEDVIVVVVGELDLATAEPLRAALMGAIRVARRQLVVDLSELAFIDSTGLHTIVDAYKRCRDGRPTLVIRPGPPNVQRVFELTNAVDYLPFERG